MLRVMQQSNMEAADRDGHLRGVAGEAFNRLAWGAAAKEVLESSPAALEARSFLMAMAETSIGLAHLRLGNLEVASKATRKALDGLVELVGSDHLYVAQAKQNMADVDLEMGHTDSAAGLLRDVQKIHQKKLHSRDPIAVTSSKKLMEVERRLGHHEAAERIHCSLKLLGVLDAESSSLC
eukprot:SM000011S19092  [mRNA]  locus=s11:859633:860940:- [translate_table: standard]